MSCGARGAAEAGTQGGSAAVARGGWPWWPCVVAAAARSRWWWWCVDATAREREESARATLVLAAAAAEPLHGRRGVRVHTCVCVCTPRRRQVARRGWASSRAARRATAQHRALGLPTRPRGSGRPAQKHEARRTSLAALAALARNSCSVAQTQTHLHAADLIVGEEGLALADDRLDLLHRRARQGRRRHPFRRGPGGWGAPASRERKQPSGRSTLDASCVGPSVVVEQQPKQRPLTPPSSPTLTVRPLLCVGRRRKGGSMWKRKTARCAKASKRITNAKWRSRPPRPPASSSSSSVAARRCGGRSKGERAAARRVAACAALLRQQQRQPAAADGQQRRRPPRPPPPRPQQAGGGGVGVAACGGGAGSSSPKAAGRAASPKPSSPKASAVRGRLAQAAAPPASAGGPTASPEPSFRTSRRQQPWSHRPLERHRVGVGRGGRGRGRCERADRQCGDAHRRGGGARSG